MDCTVIAHEKTAAVFRVRPTTFKAQGNETGSDWETIPGLGTVRWAPPEISFTDQMTLHWGEKPILLEQHPGPSSGAIWVIVPDDKVVFLGDAVLKNQPPFIAHADLPAWMEALELLLSPQYRGYTFVSGRGGTASTSAIKAQLELMEEIHEKLEKVAAKGQSPESTEKLVETFANKFKASSARHKQFAQRLRYGFRHYYARHYHMGNSADE
jgi:glyoxylase-like metal-dependent hydrolase (beta-lactamase superfamily II)